MSTNAWCRNTSALSMFPRSIKLLVQGRGLGKRSVKWAAMGQDSLICVSYALLVGSSQVHVFHRVRKVLGFLRVLATGTR